MFFRFAFPRRRLTYPKLVQAERSAKRKTEVFQICTSEAPPKLSKVSASREKCCVLLKCLGDSLFLRNFALVFKRGLPCGCRWPFFQQPCWVVMMCLKNILYAIMPLFPCYCSIRCFVRCSFCHLFWVRPVDGYLKVLNGLCRRGI